MRHALDADHLAAVAALVTRSRSVRHSVGFGVAWGTGHSLTLLLCGSAVLTFGLVVPLRAADTLELAVGAMLTLLGANLLYRLCPGRPPARPRSRSDGVGDVHVLTPRLEPGPRGLAVRALLVGMLHGMAGSAALVLLSLEAAGPTPWGLAYIAVFGVGSILGMLLLSALIAVPFALSSRRLSRARDGLTGVIAIATMMLGGSIIYRYAGLAGTAG